MGCTVNGFSLYIRCSWGLRRSGPTDPPMENGHKFAPTAPFASKFLLGNTRWFCFAFVILLQDAFSPRANQRSPISATFPVWSRRQNLGLNSACALPLKDSDTAWDSNYSHSGWETVSFSRCDFKRERLQRLATFDSLSVKMRLDARTTVCYLSGIWRQLEPLERIYGRFPSVDPQPW